MLALVDSRTFSLNMHLILGVVWVLVILAVLFLVGWTLSKIVLWRWKMHRAKRQAERERFREDGQPYPPTGRGLCDVCAKPFENVYHLYSGQRMCQDCYRRMVESIREQAGPVPPPRQTAGPVDKGDRLERATDDTSS